MGAGLFDGGPMGDPAGVPCDPECWSEESKRSVAYEFSPRRYQDQVYFCRRCRTRDVFNAMDQKHAFEVQKVNISQQRILCRACHREWVQLDREACECRRRWAADRNDHRRDVEFLRHWLFVLEALPGYNGSR